MTEDSFKQQIHDAISKTLESGEIAVSWIVVVDIAGPNGARYLSHRGGGGIDGSEPPTPWMALGMGNAISDVARDQMLSVTYIEQDPEDEEDGHR